MKTLALALALALAPSLAIAENHLMDDKKTVTYDCSKDAAVNIMGNGNTITLTGACDTINISGNHNTLTGERAKTINASGNDNTLAIATVDTVNLSGNKNAVTWKKASAKDAGPTVHNVGTGNKISATEPKK